jgi:peroxisomal 3,2-trans-enoyl-CoA isomerase
MNSRSFSQLNQIMPKIMKTSQIYRNLSSAKLEDSFRAALDNLKKLKEEPQNDVKLKLYALYKQSTTGQCTTSKPSVFNIVDKAKWEAWTSLGPMSASDAMQQYIDTVNSLLKDSGISGGSAGDSSEPHVLVENKSGVCWIRFNRPKKYNAITSEMYELFIKALQNATNDDSIKLALITANGNYYSSGNDLSESYFL